MKGEFLKNIKNEEKRSGWKLREKLLDIQNNSGIKHLMNFEQKIIWNVIPSKTKWYLKFLTTWYVCQVVLFYY